MISLLTVEKRDTLLDDSGEAEKELDEALRELNVLGAAMEAIIDDLEESATKVNETNVCSDLSSLPMTNASNR